MIPLLRATFPHSQNNASVTGKLAEQSVRGFAFGKKWKIKPSAKAKSGKKKGNSQATASSAKRRQNRPIPADKESAKQRPPSFLLSTASPNVYVSKVAAESARMDPKALFHDIVQSDYALPACFRKGSFEYFAPAKFNHGLPKTSTAEVAFLGRSNVGKSSLTNSLMGRDLARISKQPGRTQQVHYFGLLDRSSVVGYLVDLPGYGFAVGPDDAIEEWQRKTQEFLLQRRDSGNLRRLFLLIDARHGAQPFDQSVMDWFDEAAVPYSIVLTKADRVGLPGIVKRANDFCIRFTQRFVNEEETMMSPIFHITSSKDGRGIPELLSSIETEFLLEMEGTSDHQYDCESDEDKADHDDDSGEHEDTWRP